MNKALYHEMDIYNSSKAKLRFELTSFIGRKFFMHRSKISISENPMLLDIGVGGNFTKGWIHIDFYQISLNPINWIKKIWIKPLKKAEVEHDLRYPLNCADNICDGIYCSHTIEHLLPNHAIQLIMECFRILKPTKYARIIVPDFGITVNNYINKTFSSEFHAGCELIMAYTQNWGHLSTWDEEYLTLVLKEAGFVNLRVVKYGIGGTDSRLIKEEMSRKEYSIVIEAQKP